MTIEQTVESLRTQERVGFALVMAREDIRCGILQGGLTHEESTCVLSSFSLAMNQVLFGTEALEFTEHMTDPAQVLFTQLGCLGLQDTITIEDLTERIEKYTEVQGLPKALEYTIQDVIGPHIMKV